MCSSKFKETKVNQIIRNAMLANPIAPVIISIALMLFLGFAMTRITKKLRLPNVTAYIVTGILIGPYCANLIPLSVIEHMDFLSDIALAFIAFSTGEFFRLTTLKKNGMKVVILTASEACMASIAVFAVTYCLLGVNLAFSIVLAALASATAPASTMMTIRQTGARGDFVDTLLQVVALDDAVGLVLYSIAISLAVALNMGTRVNAVSILEPLAVNCGVFIIGSLFGVLLKILLGRKHSDDNRLIISVSLIFAFCGICSVLGVSPLLGCMAMGTIYINITDDSKLFMQLNYFTPPILQLFFIRSGLAFKLDMLTGTSMALGSVPLLAIGVLYFVSRIAGKYIGSFIGAAATRRSREIRNYLGLALIPQAGVAIGLAALGSRTLGGDAGSALETVILASSVLYELLGPGCAKLSLYLSHSYSTKLEDIVPDEALPEPAANAVDMLIERIRIIQEDLAKDRISPEEEAFTEAAEAQLAATMSVKARRK